jgi:hypothetical protein
LQFELGHAHQQAPRLPDQDPDERLTVPCEASRMNEV